MAASQAADRSPMGRHSSMTLLPSGVQDEARYAHSDRGISSQRVLRVPLGAPMALA